MQALEGIILKTVRLQETNEILTLFSKEQGIISLIVKRRQQSFSPLLKIEAEIMISEKELKKCRHIHVTGSFQG
ncbi:MAG TPA: recombination protein O N-terminal domain-containing protein, partial [Chlamydiales bacterium]|nr:recombination protein O N-terminal domain-containing protein [Chlamydiales bacterium]